MCNQYHPTITVIVIVMAPAIFATINRWFLSAIFGKLVTLYSCFAIALPPNWYIII